jgi:hypothetical protein
VANPTKEVHLPSDNTRPRRRNVRWNITKISLELQPIAMMSWHWKWT